MRIRFSLFSIAIGGILVLLLIGLYAIDRALASSRHLEMSLDAVEAGSAVERVITAQLGVLNGFRAIYNEARPLDPLRFRSAVEALVDTSSGISRIWLTDSLGVVVQEYRIPNLASAILAGTGINGPGIPQGLLKLVMQARTTQRPQLSRPVRFYSNVPELVLINPIMVRGQLAGFIGANIPVSAFTRAIGQLNSYPVRIVVSADNDTIARTAPDATGLFVQRVSSVISVPGGDRWTVTSTMPGNIGLRVALWLVGLIVLPMLIAGVLQERRAASRVAERSAELERLSTELLRANRAKSEFLANVSHELRTPLNAIVGFVDLLRDGVYGELAARQVSPVERIAASATHLRHLVDQVLDIAKMAAGRLEVHTEPLALRPFVLDVVSEIESLVNERGLSLSIAVGASLPKVRTDPTHLRQILMNLLGNAVKYTTSGGIAVRSKLVDPKGHPERNSSYPGIPSLDKTWIALQVADSGIGIAPGDLSRIFEEFEQVDSGSRGDSVTRGTGLGLPISRRLARLLGGEISVQSEIGHGSTFTLWLAVNPVDFRGGEHRASPEHGAPVATQEREG